MKHSIRLLSVLIILLIAGFLLGSSQAQTATPTQQVYEWCRYFDFTVGQEGWNIANAFGFSAGQYNASWSTTDIVSSGISSRLFQISIPFSGSAFITNFTAHYDYTFGHFEYTGGTVFGFDLRQLSNNASWFTLDSSQMATQNFEGTNKIYHRQHPTTVWTVNNGIMLRMVTSQDNFETQTYGGSALLRGLEFRGTSTNPFGTSNCGSFAPTPTPTATSTPEPTEYYRPLLESDFTWDLTQNPNDNPSNIAFSYEAGKPVHAAFDGTISDIQFARISDCDELLGDTTSFIFARYCTLMDPEDGPHSFDIQGAWFSASDNTYLRDVSVVTLYSSIESLTIHYLLDTPELFVSIGDEVTGGCVLGKTSPLEDEDIGVTTLSAFSGDAATDITEFLIDEPSEDAAACGVPDGDEFDTAQCLNADPTLTDIGSWVSTDPIEWLNPGVIIHSQFGDPLTAGTYTQNGHIEQLLLLDPAREPEVIISGKGLGFDGKFEVQLGDEITQFELSTYADYFQVVTATAGDADVSDLYTLRIEPNGLGSISINYVCVRHALDEDLDPVEPPLTGDAVCTLVNYSFSDIDEGWAPTGTYHWTRGEIRLDNDGTIEQSLTLPAGDYTIRANVGLYKTLGYGFDTSGTVSLEYDYDSLSDTIGSTPSYSSFEVINEVEIEDTFTIASDITDIITFTVNASNVDSEVLGVVIRSICIQPAAEGGEPVFQEQCEVISPPSGNGFGDWIQWLKAHLFKFYYCDLMRLLNLIFSLLRNFYTAFGWTARYFMAVTDLFVQWLSNEFIGWLGGHMSNITGASLSSGGGGGCNTFWCAISSVFESLIDSIFRPIIDAVLGWLNLAIEFLLDVLLLFIGLLFSVLISMLETVLWAGSLLVAIILAYTNATPQTIPGFPTCAGTDPTQNWWCMTLWVLENTIYAKTDIFTVSSPGGIITSLFIGVGSIHLAIWVAGTFRREFVSSAQGF